MDEIDYALNVGEKLLKVSRECGGKEYIRGFRSRAREFPQMVTQLGLIPSITFLLSKINDSFLIPLIKYFMYEDNFTEKLCSEFKNEGYTSYLIVNYTWIKEKLIEFQFIDKCLGSFDESMDSTDLLNSCIKSSLISILKTLKSNEELLSEIEDSVLTLSTELKKVVDGIYSGED
ncbi:type III-B CRISPR module-associated protein Cmr5 [Saccharolobus islandicus]|uniref:type III-B CRISPR module-associated protein Cmr5 n=1 Tax=Saccharolobus islandicus TaxID=43080 RepID=UPI000B324872|nr:type III-B CRISPR module-associated protein Cmr5 [Sulfolobus islandicus]